MPANYSWSNFSELLAVILAAGAFIISIVAFFRSNVVATRTQAFLEFRRHFFDIKTKLPEWYTEDDIAKWPQYKIDSTDWRSLESYWQNAFNEWFITTKVDSLVLGRLWRLFYRDVIKSCLELKPLRFQASRLTHGETEFGNYRDEFRKVLDELWRESDSKGRRNICDGFNCKQCTPAE